VQVLRDLAYGGYRLDDQEMPLLLDLYLVAESERRPAPLIVFIHGGGWFKGTKDDCPAAPLVQAGFAVACVDYRLATIEGGCKPELTFPAQIHDVKGAVRWLRHNAPRHGFDASRIAAMGPSSGGHLAALRGTSHGVPDLTGPQNIGPSDEVQAVVDWFGPVDVTQPPPQIVFEDDPCELGFAALGDKYGGEATPFFYWTFAWASFLGGSLVHPAVLDRAIQASPLTHVDAGDPPFLIIHGTEDNVVPIAQSEHLVAALNRADVEVVFQPLPGAGHNYGGPPGSGREVSPEYLEPTTEFLRRILQPQ
jgi:acetyl esterase/lipase